MSNSAIDIWVSAGSLSSPFYRYYTDSSGTTELLDLILDPNKRYTFRRLNEASTHPFYLKEDPDNTGGRPDYSLSGDGSTSIGITGNQSFTLSFSDPNQAPDSLVTYCTSHSSMQKAWSINRAPDPEPTPKPEPKPELELELELENYKPPTTKNNINGSKKDDELTGSQKSDFITGNRGGDTLSGSKGNDVLLGDQGNDFLHGSNGKDYLDGSKGIDTLVGGKGADVFQISKGIDLVEDFNIKKGDRIALDSKGKYTIINDPKGTLIMISAKKQLFLDGVNYGNIIAAGSELFVQIV
jgi:hypothetical protein